MKWVEIISLRCPANIDTQIVDELLKQVRESDLPTDTPKHLEEIRAYHHSVVETDVSIQIYWKSEPGRQRKSSLGLRLSSALKNLGLLNHSVWVETAALEFPYGNSRSGDILSSDRKGTATCQPPGGSKAKHQPDSTMSPEPAKRDDHRNMGCGSTQARDEARRNDI